MPGKKVLIIDDNERNIYALEEQLRRRGYECVAATTVLHALAMLEEPGSVGIVLLDMVMPDMDGYDAIPKIKEVQDLPVIAVTERPLAGDWERCLAAGANDCIARPIDIDRLVEIIEIYM